VNLRDIGEVDPRLRKGVLFRCSQIYTPDVLKELKIRTVVDLRGRAEKKNAKSSSKSGKHRKAAAPAGPPQLLPYDQVESLTSAGPAGSPSAAAAGADLNRGQQGGGPGPAGASFAAPSTASPANDIAVTRLRHNASTASISSVDSEEDSGNGNGGTVRRASGAEEMAVGLTEGVEDAMGFGTPDREMFNVIPTKEFGLAMLRMPW
jgi:hypothetical protein